METYKLLARIYDPYMPIPPEINGFLNIRETGKCLAATNFGRLAKSFPQWIIVIRMYVAEIQFLIRSN